MIVHLELRYAIGRKVFLLSTGVAGRLILGVLLVLVQLCSTQAATSVTLAWDQNPEPDVVGYKLYYGNSSGNYSSMVDAGNNTTATVSNLPTHTTYFFVVRAYNATGLESSSSNEVTFAAPNQPPVVSIASPGNGTTLNGPASVSLTANASDPDGNIAKVEFFEGTTLLGQASTTPFAIPWEAVPVGSHVISAVAYDNDGVATPSAPVSLTIVRLEANGFRRLADGSFEFSVEGAVGSRIRVYASSDLVNWTLRTTVTNSTGSFTISDSDAANYDRRFYKLQSE